MTAIRLHIEHLTVEAPETTFFGGLGSGESLAMSPALLKKYLAAARLVADHIVLKPKGFAFAPPLPVAPAPCSRPSVSHCRR